MDVGKGWNLSGFFSHHPVMQETLRSSAMSSWKTSYLWLLEHEQSFSRMGYPSSPFMIYSDPYPLSCTLVSLQLHKKDSSNWSEKLVFYQSVDLQVAPGKAKHMEPSVAWCSFILDLSGGCVLTFELWKMSSCELGIRNIFVLCGFSGT